MPTAIRVTSALRFLLLPVALAAQSPVERAALAGRDNALTTAALPPTMPGSLSGSAESIWQGYDEVAHWLDGGGVGEVELALRRFAYTAAGEPDWAWPHYAMARTMVLMHQQDVPKRNSAGTRVAESYLHAAFRHLDAALKLDPDLVPARDLLVELTLPSGDRELFDPTRKALAREVSRPDPRPGAVVVWARYQRSELNYRAALAGFDRAATLGFDPASIDLERARTLAALGRSTDAATAYWAGVNQMTPASRQLYSQDLGYFLAPDSLARFDAVPRDSTKAWLHRFWSQRDAAVLGKRNQRLTDQLKRWVFAFAHFRVPSPWRITEHKRVDFAFDPITAQCIGGASGFYDRLPIHPPLLAGDPRAREPLLDNRATILLRHGWPTFGMALPVNSQLEPQPDISRVGIDPPEGQESARLAMSMARTGLWVYWFEGSWRVLTFRGSDALGHHAPTTLSSHLVVANPRAWLTLAAIFPWYQAAANRIVNYHGYQSITCLPDVDRAIAQQRIDADTAIVTDSDAPPIQQPWGAIFQFFGLGRGHGNDGRALLTFAIPINRLVGDTLPDGQIEWQIDFRYTAYRLGDGVRIDLDTTRTFRSHQPQTGGILTGWIEMPLAPGRWQVAALARQPNDTVTGAYALAREVRIAGSARLALSDIVTGRAGQALWPAPDGPFPVNAIGAWPEDGQVELWYEVRGVGLGQPYQSTIAVAPINDPEQQVIAITGTNRSNGPVTRVRRSLGLARLKPGSYRLTITVSHGSDSATRSRVIRLLD